jgi:phosphatidylglycerophosphate synthase
MYQTFDALDGKQARRTGTSSPLGELFDHGCDAMTTFFLGVVAMASWRTGDSVHSFLTLWLSMTMFFLSQWDVYFSGQLFLGPFNVTETQFIVMGIHLTCFFAGSDFWTRTFVVPGTDWVWAYRTPMQVLAYAMAAMNLFDFLKNVWKSVHGKNAWNLSVSEMRKRALLYAFPALFTAFWTAAWAYVEPALISRFTIVYDVAFGFVFANLVGRIVTYRVCHVEYESWYWIIVPLPFLVAHSYFNLGLLPLSQVVWGYCILAAVTYLHFGLSLIDEMTDYLRIRALVIPYPNLATKDDMWAKLFTPSAVEKSIKMAEAAAKKVK